MMKNRFTLSMVAALLVVFTACQNRSGQTGKTDTTAKAGIDETRIREEIISLLNTLPGTPETAKLINQTGASYLAGFTAEDLKTETLLTRADKAIAFGSVLFDLGYTNIYNQVEPFTKLLKVSESLTKELGFNKIMDLQQDFRKNFDKQKGDVQAVDKLVNDLIRNTTEEVRENGSVKDLTLVFAGSVTKSLHVITYLTLFSPGRDQLMEALKEQKAAIKTLCDVLAKVPEDPDLSRYLEVMLPVNRMFQSDEPFTSESIEEINKLTGSLVTK